MLKRLLLAVALLCGVVFAQAPERKAISIPTVQMKALRESYAALSSAEFVLDSAGRLLVDKSDCNRQVIIILTLDRDKRKAEWEAVKAAAWSEFDAPKGFILDLDRGEFRSQAKD